LQWNLSAIQDDRRDAQRYRSLRSMAIQDGVTSEDGSPASADKFDAEVDQYIEGWKRD
jgi:hypothetical protein